MNIICTNESACLYISVLTKKLCIVKLNEPKVSFKYPFAVVCFHRLQRSDTDNICIQRAPYFGSAVNYPRHARFREVN